MAVTASGDARRGEGGSPSMGRSRVSRLPADRPPLEPGDPLSALASRFDLADLDQLETEGAHALEHPVEGGLVEVRAAKNGLGGLEIGVQAVEARKQGIADSASDTDLVIVDGHHSTPIFGRRWVTKPHPVGMTTHTRSVLRIGFDNA
jgi:hypothetical protein